MSKLAIFREANGTFSWRKAGTALCFLLFAFCVIGNQIKNNFIELPDGYMVMISMVFAFYFFKEPISNLSFGTKTVKSEKGV